MVPIRFGTELCDLARPSQCFRTLSQTGNANQNPWLMPGWWIGGHYANAPRGGLCHAS